MSAPRQRSTRPIQRCIAETLEARHLLSSAWMIDTQGHKVRMDPTLKAVLRESEDPSGGIAGPVSNLTATPTTPSLTNSWDAVAFADNATLNGGFLFIPPDPNGAAGPTQVLNIANCAVEWFTKTGTRQYLQSLQTFFSPLSPVNSLYDPKVIYDQYNGRFVIVSLEQQTHPNTSRVLVAVSKTSDPNDGFWYQAINTAVQFGHSTGWFDYPGLAISSTAIYLTGNIFSFSSDSFQGSRLWILDKGMYTGGTSAVNLYDPSTRAGLSSEAFTLQPTLMYGSAPGSVGTYLVSSGWTSGSSEEISVIRIDNPLSSPTFTNFLINVGDISSTSTPPEAPQLGGSQTLDSGDGRIFNAVWRNGHLYFANDISPNTGPDAGQTTAHWYNFSADASTVSLADQGNVGGEDIASGTYTYYPAVNVDANGDMAIGFSASAPTIYAGAYYTMRLASDPAGTVEASMTLAAGTDYYYRTFGGSANRWGDYSGLALDPADGMTFWVYNEYAATRGNSNGGDGQWATRWGRFGLAPAAPTGISLDAAYDSGILNNDRLTNNDNSSLTKALEFTVSGTTPGDTVRIYADGVLIGTAPAGPGSTTTVLTDGTTALAQGARSITAREYLAGIESADSPAVVVTIDSAPPAQPSAPTLDPASDSGISNSDGITNIPTPLLHTPSTDTYERILIDGVQVTGDYYAVSSYLAAAQSEGTHTYAIYAVDAAGNVSILSNALSVTYDYAAPAAPTVTINNGAVQRSMVTSLDIQFAESVYLSANAIEVLLRTGLAAPGVTLSIATGNNELYHITFTGAGVVGGSLPDGAYKLLVTAANVMDAAGNAPASDLSQPFFRLFGDADGDRTVSASDLALFRASLNQPLNYVPYFDYNGDGVIDNTDYAQFRMRLPRTLL